MSKLIEQLKLDFRLEVRNWPQSVALVLFMWVISYIVFRIQSEMSIQQFNFLFWIFILIVSVSIAIQASNHGNEGQRIFQYTLVDPVLALVSRMIIIIVYLLVVSLSLYGCMLFLFYPQVQPSTDFLTVILMGAFAIGSVTSFAGSLSRHVNHQNATVSILIIPVLIPILLILNRIGGSVVMGNPIESRMILSLLGISFLFVALSIVLFPYLWRE